MNFQFDLRPVVAVFFFLVSSTVFAQQPQCFINSSSDDICTVCSSGSNPALVDGVFTGRMIVARNVRITLPGSCSSATFVLTGNAEFDIDHSAQLTFPDDVSVAPSTVVNVFGHNRGEAVYQGQTYGHKGSGGNYAVLNNTLSQPADGGIGPGGSDQSALPVALTDWTATYGDGAVELTWTTVDEYDNDYFVVEHSSDAVDFTEIARVPSQATKRQTETAYRIRHAAFPAGTNYYRLIQYDFDGTRTDFDVLQVRGADGRDRLTAFPNPVGPGQEVTIETDAEQTVDLVAGDGNVVRVYPSGERTLQLPADLTPGLYVLRQGRRAQRLLVR